MITSQSSIVFMLSIQRYFLRKILLVLAQISKKFNGADLYNQPLIN